MSLTSRLRMFQGGYKEINMRTNFQMEYQNITMVKGDTLAFNVEVRDQDGEILEVDSANMTCKKDPLGEDVVFHKYIGNGIIQSEGLLTVRVAPLDTKDADAGRYFYDLNIGVGNDIFTLMIGTLTLEQDVTI